MSSLSSARARAAVCWFAALACGASLTHRALHARDDSARADGNGGHAEIDFGGQWLMGRVLVTGRGPELYSRHAQWAELRRAYPEPGDADRLMHWFMGADAPEWKRLGGAACAPLAVPPHPLVGFAHARASEAAVAPDLVAKLNARAVGGPLYPPVHALLYAPLGALDPQPAYRAFQIFSALCVFVAALGVRALTGGRVWCSVAALLLFLYPGTRGALDLGQNSVLTLAIVVWGWALAARGRWGAGGAVWGLLAFKPVWGVALVLVPLLMRRWKFCLAMAATGIALAALTLPFVGAHAWFDWLRNGREASAVYTTDENWIDLSRDLQSIPRRALHDFAKPPAERDTALAAGLARGLWLGVLAGTAAVYLCRGARARPTGLSAGFAFLGGYLSCFHFMYYDALISAAALFVLFASREARRGRFAWACVAVGFAFENALNALRWEFAVAGVRFDTTVRFPWDTFALLALWAWAAARLVRRGEGA